MNFKVLSNLCMLGSEVEPVSKMTVGNISLGLDFHSLMFIIDKIKLT